jgi:hypothetical protein
MEAVIMLACAHAQAGHLYAGYATCQLVCAPKHFPYCHLLSVTQGNSSNIIYGGLDEVLSAPRTLLRLFGKPQVRKDAPLLCSCETNQFEKRPSTKSIPKNQSVVCLGAGSGPAKDGRDLHP